MKCLFFVMCLSLCSYSFAKKDPESFKKPLALSSSSAISLMVLYGGKHMHREIKGVKMYTKGPYKNIIHSFEPGDKIVHKNNLGFWLSKKKTIDGTANNLNKLIERRGVYSLKKVGNIVTARSWSTRGIAETILLATAVGAGIYQGIESVNVLNEQRSPGKPLLQSSQSDSTEKVISKVQ